MAKVEVDCLIVISQVGTANAFRPFYQSKNFRFKILVYPNVCDFLDKLNVEYEIIEEFNHSYLEKINPKIILCASGSLEKNKFNITNFWIEAKRLGIPSFVYVDNWVNYKNRFTMNEDWDALPDKILVIDETMSSAYKELGISPDLLEIVGNPAFDDLVKINPIKETNNLLFVSEPFFENNPNQDFSQYNVLNEIIDNVNNYNLKVRLHPREDKKTFQEKFSKPIIFSEESNYEAIEWSSKVIGLQSIFNYEAALAGRMVGVYMPEDREPSFTGHGNVTYLKNEEDLKKFLEKPLALSENRSHAKSNLYEYIKKRTL